jgi:hypothetical protein
MRAAQSNSRGFILSAVAAVALATMAVSQASADDPQTAGQRLLISEPAAPTLLGRSLRPDPQDRVVQTRRPKSRGPVIQASGETERSTTEAPPVPMEPDELSPTPRAAEPAVIPGPATVARPPLPPPVPFVPPFANRSAFHQRLWAKRLARVQQMRQQAEQNGDEQGAQRAQYLEGMVNELHRQGLFNFAQKVVGAMQDGKLNGAAAGLLGSGSAADAPATDLGSPGALPEADLGEPAPLPETDLGTPAPLPTDDSEATPETPPALPPAP